MDSIGRRNFVMPYEIARRRLNKITLEDLQKNYVSIMKKQFKGKNGTLLETFPVLGIVADRPNLKEYKQMVPEKTMCDLSETIEAHDEVNNMNQIITSQINLTLCAQMKDVLFGGIERMDRGGEARDLLSEYQQRLREHWNPYRMSDCSVTQWSGTLQKIIEDSKTKSDILSAVALYREKLTKSVELFNQTGHLEFTHGLLGFLMETLPYVMQTEVIDRFQHSFEHVYVKFRDTYWKTYRKYFSNVAVRIDNALQLISENRTDNGHMMLRNEINKLIMECKNYRTLPMSAEEVKQFQHLMNAVTPSNVEHGSHLMNFHCSRYAVARHRLYCYSVQCDLIETLAPSVTPGRLSQIVIEGKDITELDMTPVISSANEVYRESIKDMERALDRVVRKCTKLFEEVYSHQMGIMNSNIERMNTIYHEVDVLIDIARKKSKLYSHRWLRKHQQCNSQDNTLRWTRVRTPLPSPEASETASRVYSHILHQVDPSFNWEMLPEVIESYQRATHHNMSSELRSFRNWVTANLLYVPN